MYSVLNLKTDLTGIIHGTTLNSVVNLNGLINRSARDVLLDVDPQETKRIVEFTNPIFSDVYDYALPVDLKGNKVIDIRPQVDRNYSDIFLQNYNQTFDVQKIWTLSDSFTINFNSSLKSIRINAPTLTAPIIVNQAASIDSNGTWTVGGGATDLSVDNINFVAGGGSLKFNLSAGQTTGYLENSTMNAVDLTNDLNQATEFLYSYLPTGSAVTSINYRWGSSSANYYSLSATVTQQDTIFQNGWNLINFNWANASVTGSPDVSNITYLRITWTYDSTLQTGVRLNSITSNLGSILELEYYSKYLFRSNLTGAYQETVLDDSDLINLDTESYDLLLYKLADLVAQQLQGSDANYDATYFETKYQNALARYMSMYKSEVQKPQGTYYIFPRKGYSGYVGRRWN